jgi:hypothetical protein
MLTMAAPAPSGPERGPMLVLLAGLVTSALTLLGVWWLDVNTKDFHVMGWYADYVLPAGAILVGLSAGSGYGIVSYLTGYRIRRGLLGAVLALQLGAYGAAQYLEFRALMAETPLVDRDGNEIAFATYYHATAMTFRWDDHGRQGKPLGGWGYVFLGLGVVGFAAGGVIAPAALMKFPYCERCQLYMKQRTLALIPASVRPRRVKEAAAKEAFAAENKAAADAAQAVLDQLVALAAKGDARAIASALGPYPAGGSDGRTANRLPSRLRVGLVHCRNCGSGHLLPAIITGQGRGIRVQLLARADLTPDATHLLAT